MDVSVRWHGRGAPHEYEFTGTTADGLATEIGARSAPGGPKAAPTPKELVAMGMAACTGIDMVSLLGTMRQPLESLRVGCSVVTRKEPPTVFESCVLTYEVDGPGLAESRVVRALALSYTKHCGVSIMIKRGGCEITPRLLLNGREVALPSLDEASREDGTHMDNDTARGVGLLITGNEVLFGKTRDTNGPFMASHLRKAGREVKRSLIAGDDRTELARALRYLSETCGTVLMTGGLGPTSDDLTAEVVGSFLGLPLEFSEPAWAACVEAFARMGRAEVPETNRKQAMLPRGCRLIPNAAGTAVGFSTDGTVDGRRLTIICLPGVPFEMEPMFFEHVLPGLGAPGTVVVSRAWQVFGLGESAMQQRVGELESRVAAELPEAVVSYQAHAGYVTYSIFAQAEGQARARAVEAAMGDWFGHGVEEAFGHHVVARTEKPFGPYVVESYAAAGLRLAVAESCTGGLLSKEIVAVPGSSACYLGGVTAYANALKESLLGVGKGVLAEHGAVSEPVARAMAEGVLARTGADVGLSITGVAGPTGGTERVPVGTVCLALSWRAGRLDGDRVVSRLGAFKWKDAPSLVNGAATGDDVRSMVVTLSLGRRARRDVIQLRSTVFALGSLALVASAFKREQA